MRITELTGALGRQAEVSSARFLRGKSEALGWVLGCVVLLMPVAASAQATYRPTRPPIVTAESERWYLEGQPITYWGSVYYPAGPAVFFNPNEMARSGDYKGIPLYAMKTRDLFDVVFVPVGSGLLQPYERRRDGDVAGTVGNSAPSFPVDRDYEPSLWDAVPQAAGPPVLRQFYPIDDYSPMPASASPLLAESGAVERTAAAISLGVRSRRRSNQPVSTRSTSITRAGAGSRMVALCCSIRRSLRAPANTTGLPSTRATLRRRPSTSRSPTPRAVC